MRLLKRRRGGAVVWTMTRRTCWPGAGRARAATAAGRLPAEVRGVMKTTPGWSGCIRVASICAVIDLICLQLCWVFPFVSTQKRLPSRAHPHAPRPRAPAPGLADLFRCGPRLFGQRRRVGVQRGSTVGPIHLLQPALALLSPHLQLKLLDDVARWVLVGGAPASFGPGHVAALWAALDFTFAPLDIERDEAPVSEAPEPKAPSASAPCSLGSA